MTISTETPIKDLPDWMRSAYRDLDWGVFLVIAFSLLVALPFITQPTLPHSNASENYVYATANFATAFQEGRLYPRWSPYVFGGYGAPIPNFYPPGAPYFAALLQVLITDDPILSVRLTYILALCLAGVAVYLLVSRRTNAATGSLAAFLYLYSPSVGLVTPHLLGDLPAVMAAALMPLLLRSLDRLLLHNHALDVLLITLVTAALFFTDVQAGLVGLLLSALLLIWQQTTSRHAPWLIAISGLMLGIGVAGCYWIPALLEQSAITWLPPLVTPTFRLTIAELIAPLQYVDLNNQLPTPQFTLGLPIILLTFFGTAIMIRCRQFWNFQAMFLLTGFGLAALSLIWFPSQINLLLPLTLCLAIGSSATLTARDWLRPYWQRLVLPVTLVIVWLLAAPVWLTPQTTELFGATDAITQLEYEQSGFGIPVLPPSKPVPATISASLATNRTLIRQQPSGTVDKVNVATANTRVQIGILAHQTHSDRLQITASETVTLNVLTAAFPGWYATLNGRPIPLVTNPQTGLMSLTTQPGRGSQLLIELGPTPIRSSAWVITGLTLVIALILTGGRLRQHKPIFEEIRLLAREEVRLLALVGLGLTLLTPLVTAPDSPLSLRQSANHEVASATPLQIRTDTGLSLSAFRLNRVQFQPGETFELTLYWHAQRPLSENYQALFYLLNTRTGERWHQTDFHHPGHYPTQRWNTNRYVPETYEFTIDPALPSGSYSAIIEVYACDTECLPQNRLTFFNTTGRNLGPVLSMPDTLTIDG
ncbi:MAG TPA: 6-pyruvoyl-tetrahydropterin synthase-related protein [Phototrophicaceae bacterium]|nr:6-pyruvoyl-tetrahydropterin synthase-related protein [Phototrophicaceae bacterium]